jgi:serine/threonine protein kinase
MPVRIEPHAEPIPGYRLIERLGVGGFGEVWKCVAPGGLFKAIKVVHGELGATGAVADEDSRADQELKALKRVKTVHHPYILSLERYDIVDGQLMIVMELADRTLWDRFRECRTQGLPGIPREELIGYMRETAEALDLMNDQFQLQHLDIKPQNLFLVFNHVKVADFGLVKDLGTKATATITGGVTPVYAAPETFDGWLSRFSDQYSLAIVYQELLTGQRPFAGATMRQLVLQHLQGNPDLTPLPAADRAIVSRALSKDPDRRFPNCLEFVQHLHSVSPGLRPEPEPLGVDTTEPHQTEAQTFDARGKGMGPRRPSDADLNLDAGRPQVLPPRPQPAFGPLNGHDLSTSETPSLQKIGATVPARRTPLGIDLGPDTRGPIQPALILGLGGIGLRTLHLLRRRLTQDLARAEDMPHVRLLGLDTNPEAIQAAGAGEPGEALRGSELMTLRLHRPSHYLRAGGKSVTDTWLNPKLLYRIPREQTSASLRPLGRLAFVDSARPLLRRLRAELSTVIEAAAEPACREALAARGLTPRVYIATCLAGNSGSGMFLDMAYAVRDALRELGQPRAEVVGVFYLPAGDSTSRTGQTNAYAALAELNHFSQHSFVGLYDNGEPNTDPIVVRDDQPPFTRCVLFTLPRVGQSGSDATGQTLAIASDYLFRDVATPLGRTADEARRQRMNEVGASAAPTFHMIGINRLSWPRQALVERGSRRLCRRLVEAWMSKDARQLVDAMTQWADGKWDGVGLRPEALIGRMQQLCEKFLKQSPDRMVTAITGPLAEALMPQPGKPDAPVAFGPAVTALADLDRLLGVPDECRASNQPPAPPGTLEATLASVTTRLADAAEQRLAEHVAKLVEDPNYRLAGAEEALRRLSAVAERALQSQETLARELNERAALLYQRAQKCVETGPPPTVSSHATAWKLTLGRRTPKGPATSPVAELLELIRQYPKARYHALVLQHINRLYIGLRGQLSDQLREVGFCRQRLSELANLVQPPTSSTADPAAPARVLLPEGCESLDDALEQMEKSLTRDDVIAFDLQVQGIIHHHCRGLVNVCMGSSAIVRMLAPAMVGCARDFLKPRFAGTSVAELLLAAPPEEQDDKTESAIRQVQEIYQRAAPRPGETSPDAEFAVAVLPGDERGQDLQGLVRDDLPQAAFVGTEHPDEVVFYREAIYLSSAGIEQVGAAALEAYRHRMAADPVALHSREDIPDWNPTAALAR